MRIFCGRRKGEPVTTLYIDRKDIELQVSNGVLEFHERAGRRGSIPLAQIDRVVLRGRVQLSTSVLGALTEAGAGVLSLSGRFNRHLATCVGRPHKDVVRRLGQFDAYRDPDARAQWSRMLIAAKTAAQLRLLRQALDRRPGKRRPLTRAIAQLERLLARVSDTAQCPGVATILGIEGAAAAGYFAGYRALFAPSLQFRERNRRPPGDPVKRLSFARIHSPAFRGSDCVPHGRPGPDARPLSSTGIRSRVVGPPISLKPLRPHIDEWVWALFRERVLSKRSFREDNGAVLLDKIARRNFLYTLSSSQRRLAPPAPTPGKRCGAGVRKARTRYSSFRGNGFSLAMNPASFLRRRVIDRGLKQPCCSLSVPISRGASIVPANRRTPWLVCYDIADKSRLQRVHRLISRRAIPFQHSVFYINATRNDIVDMVGEIAIRINPHHDDVRAYPLLTTARPFCLLVAVDCLTGPYSSIGHGCSLTIHLPWMANSQPISDESRLFTVSSTLFYSQLHRKTMRAQYPS